MTKPPAQSKTKGFITGNRFYINTKGATMNNNNDLFEFWATLPTDSRRPATYTELMNAWNCDRRTVRKILAELSAWDNGDGFILIRSSHGEGFYKTNDRRRIEKYKKEVYNRAINTMKPLKKIRRVLGISGQITFDELLFEYETTGGAL